MKVGNLNIDFSIESGQPFLSIKDGETQVLRSHMETEAALLYLALEFQVKQTQCLESIQRDIRYIKTELEKEVNKFKTK